MYVSDTEDDVTLTHRSTHDYVLNVSPEALAKVFFRLVFKLIRLWHPLSMEQREMGFIKTF